MTVGELIAFNMLASQVSSPILRLAQLWNDFQQVGLSMSRLGDILDARTEVAGNKTRLPRVDGAIEFDQVSFRYRAWWINHHYQFTTWAWGRVAIVLLLVGMILRLMLAA